MPRKARLDAPNALHHIISRGIEKRPIFKGNKDRDHFLERLEKVLQETGTPCFAWALMPNHFHLLMKTGRTPIATVMRRLLTGYAVYFNRRHDRHGQLFQNRYKSFLCQEDVYLKELVRYIHLNPLRAGLVNDLSALKSFPYCGHGVLTGDAQCAWQDTAYILRMYGKRKKQAIAAYLSHVEDGAAIGRRHDLTGGGMVRSQGGWESVMQLKRENLRIKGDERILGDSDFVQSVLEQAAERMTDRYLLSIAGVDFEKMAQGIADAFGVDVEAIRTKRRRGRISRARSLLAYRAFHELGLTMVAIGKLLNISQPAVSKAVERGSEIDKELKGA